VYLRLNRDSLSFANTGVHTSFYTHSGLVWWVRVAFALFVCVVCLVHNVACISGFPLLIVLHFFSRLFKGVKMQQKARYNGYA